ncbi:MAG: hypothetical protein IJ307_00985 [Bacteroidales bacterium]|nr:hypothetical protein [Bacteroidales bacterium]
MGSVIDYVRCPQCGGTYFRDYKYRTSEEYCSCVRCGKTDRWFIKRDDAGNACLDDAGKPQYVEESHTGYGVAYITGNKGVGRILHFIEPVNEQTKDAFFETLSTVPDIDKAKCYLTSWDDEKGEVIALFGSIPPLFEEEMGTSAEVSE